MTKRTKGSNSFNNKRTVQVTPAKSSDNCKQIWVFDSIDRDGIFHFSTLRGDMDCQIILTKVIEYSQRTWQEIKSETHDNGKGCHHFLDPAALSKEAQSRITKMNMGNDTDSIFSMRLSNKIRIIGIRRYEKFIVKWFDPEHKFCPST